MLARLCRARWSVKLGFLIAVLVVGVCHAASILPDLSINYVCVGNANPPSDDAIEAALLGMGFRVLNKTRLAQEQHVPYLLNQDIVAIDDSHREIRFTQVPTCKAPYFVALYAPPPTRRSTALEERLLTFVTKKLGCELDRVERHENGDDARRFYDEVFAQAEDNFRQADELKRAP
jgi:hypothetical protein